MAFWTNTIDPLEYSTGCSNRPSRRAKRGGLWPIGHRVISCVLALLPPAQSRSHDLLRPLPTPHLGCDVAIDAESRNGGIAGRSSKQGRGKAKT